MSIIKTPHLFKQTQCCSSKKQINNRRNKVSCDRTAAEECLQKNQYTAGKGFLFYSLSFSFFLNVLISKKFLI
jgi:hypothetical protein